MSLPATARAARDLSGSWLAHLRRDVRGLPVPWINRWGEESAAATRIAFDPCAGRRSIFHDDYGPVPNFLAQNMGRQRRAVYEGRCQVCGRLCPWSRRNLVISGVSAENVTVDGQVLGAIIEPWLDDRCAAIATLLCPALIRRRHDDDLRVLPVRRERDVHLVLSIGYLDVEVLAAAVPDAQRDTHVARLLAEAGREPLGMWLKLVPLAHPILCTRSPATT
jgi:hypothetical protein